MSVPRPVVDDAGRIALDGIAHPVAIGSSIRDGDGRIVDFRVVFVNRASATWSGITDRDAAVGGSLLQGVPTFARSGFFDALVHVVQTGQPFTQRGVQYDVASGPSYMAGTYDITVVRHGDGYVTAWRRVDDGAAASEDLDSSVAIAREVVKLVRLESRGLAAPPRLRLRPAI